MTKKEKETFRYIKRRLNRLENLVSRIDFLSLFCESEERATDLYNHKISLLSQYEYLTSMFTKLESKTKKVSTKKSRF